MPIAHIAGGDVTEGAFDDGFRHAITKMAQLHFPTNADAARRIRQLGEADERIHMVGSPGRSLIAKRRYRRATLSSHRSASCQDDEISIVTFHPVTLVADSLAELEEMLAALDERR